MASNASSNEAMVSLKGVAREKSVFIALSMCLSLAMSPLECVFSLSNFHASLADVTLSRAPCKAGVTIAPSAPTIMSFIILHSFMALVSVSAGCDPSTYHHSPWALSANLASLDQRIQSPSVSFVISDENLTADISADNILGRFLGSGVVAHNLLRL